MPGVGFGAEEEAYAWRTGRAAPAPATVTNPTIRAQVNQMKQVQNAIAQVQMAAQAVAKWPAAAIAPPPQVSKPVTLYQQAQSQWASNFMLSNPVTLTQASPLLGGDAPAGALPAPTISKAPTGLPTLLGSDYPAGGLKEPKKDPAYTGLGTRDARVLKEDRQHSAETWAHQTIEKMIDDVKKDPAATPEALAAAELIGRQFHTELYSRYWTQAEAETNPLLMQLNNIAVWSRFRRQVSEWQANKNKLGTDTQDNGDGSFGNLITGSFSQKTGTGNVPGFMVARDEKGNLYITDVDTWINSKMADMKADPALAAATITALASIQAYGGDSAANSAAGSRVVTDAAGNPVKAFISNEDYSALKNMALLAVNSQTAGNEETLDDFFAELTAQSQEIYNDPQWTAPGGSGGGGGGYYGYGGGGYGGAGGDGGTGQVRYTDSEMLGAQVDAIARQRMGRQLTPEEKAEFIAFYHQLEAQMTAQYYGGMATTVLDPQGQAVGWIESRFAQERGAQAYGNMAAAFMRMVGAKGFTGALGSN